MNVWKAILAALVIFGAGVVTGGLTVRLKQNQIVQSPPPPAGTPGFPMLRQYRAEYMRRLEKNLDLTPEQHSRIEEHLRESQERLRRAWEPINPAAAEEARRVRRQILDELTPSQRKKFEELFRPKAGHRTNEMSEIRRKQIDRNKMGDIPPARRDQSSPPK